MPVYDFNKDSERIRWLSTAYRPHGISMLERWRDQKTKQIGKAKAQEWMLELIKAAK